MTDLKDLARRVSELQGPSREVTMEIINFAYDHSWSLGREVVNYDPELWFERFERYGWDPLASLDAAMTLVPEGAALSFARSFIGSCSARVVDIDLGNASRFDVEAVAATPALSLTAAALLARSEA